MSWIEVPVSKYIKILKHIIVRSSVVVGQRILKYFMLMLLLTERVANPTGFRAAHLPF